MTMTKDVEISKPMPIDARICTRSSGRDILSGTIPAPYDLGAILAYVQSSLLQYSRCTHDST